jgi:hypothetical protein
MQLPGPPKGLTQPPTAGSSPPRRWSAVRERAGCFLPLPIILLLALSPWLAWFLQPVRPLAVLIVDKTVPTTSYREHKGLMWVLNRFRFVDPSLGAPFRYDRDYVGFFPQPDRRYATTPVSAAGRRLDAAYVTDTYGVYTADYYGEDTHGVRSRLLYGGLREGELDAVTSALRPGGILITEFNTFADPTAAAERAHATDVLGVDWSGWSGRFYQDLDRGGEVPVWLVQNYEAQYRRPWAFTGPGFAFVHDDDRVFILVEARDVRPFGLRVVFPDSVARRYGVANRVPYFYWFDIVRPRAGTLVEAEYEFQALPPGRAALDSAGIPARFPAILHRRDPAFDRFYFAGDFADNDEIPWPFRLRGWDRVERLLAWTKGESNALFFWGVYVPLLHHLLGDAARAPAR